VPRSTIGEISLEAQARRRTAFRRARSGDLVALPRLLRGAGGRTPSAVAAVRFCSRSSGDRIVRADRAGTRTFEEANAQSPRQRRRRLTPALNRSVLALLKPAPRAFGGGRTRWRGAARAPELHLRRGIEVAAETMRPWLPEVGWAGKRATVAANDEEPDRVTQLARIRLAFAQRCAGAALFFADEWDINLLPKVGAHWLPTGEHVAVLTPGTKEKRSLAGPWT